jgi:hypothetical protein
MAEAGIHCILKAFMLAGKLVNGLAGNYRSHG